jgi:hypothetical protein
MKVHQISCLAVCVLLFPGCGKKEPPAPQSYDISGVKVDMPKLQTTFQNAPPELLNPVNTASSMVRYGQYERAMQALDGLLSNPALNDAQKKVVTDVLEELKQVIQKAGPTRQ